MSYLKSDVDAFLEHSGVMGMKWGVRKDLGVTTVKFDKSSKELVKKAKKNYIDVTDKAMEIRFNQWLGDSTIDSSKLSTRSRTIKEGRDLYRVSKTKNLDLAETTYLSTNVSDRTKYRAVLGSVGGLAIARKSYSPTYETTVKAMKDLSLPSEKARFDAFVELLDTKAIPVGIRGKKMITGRELLKRTGAARDVRKLDSVLLGEKYYTSFVGDQGNKTRINSAYFKLLREKGYDAISDDNDRNVVSNDPLIVLDSKTSVKTMYVKQLSNDEINKAIATFTPPKNIDKVVANSNQLNRRKSGDE